MYIDIYTLLPLQSAELVRLQTSKSSIHFKIPAQTARPRSPKQPCTSPGSPSRTHESINPGRMLPNLSNFFL